MRATPAGGRGDRLRRRRRPVAGHRGGPVRASPRRVGRARQDPDRSPGARPPTLPSALPDRAPTPPWWRRWPTMRRAACCARHCWRSTSSLRALPATRTAAVIALLDAVGERTMLSDRQTLDPAGVAPLLEGLDWIHCSGYPLLDDRTGDDAGRAARRPETEGSAEHRRRLRPVRIRLGWRGFRARLEQARPDVVIMSGEEADALLAGRPARALAAAAALQPLASIVIVTVGADGSAAVAEGIAAGGRRPAAARADARRHRQRRRLRRRPAGRADGRRGDRLAARRRRADRRHGGGQPAGRPGLPRAGRPGSRRRRGSVRHEPAGQRRGPRDAGRRWGGGGARIEPDCSWPAVPAQPGNGARLRSCRTRRWRGARHHGTVRR